MAIFDAPDGIEYIVYDFISETKKIKSQKFSVCNFSSGSLFDFKI